MRLGSFEFSRRELAGSMGDFGTLLPLAIGYIVVCGMDPSGFLVMLGLVNIVTGLIYRIPMPVQPKKVVAVMAIAQGWTPSMIYATGFGTGLIWLFLGATGWIQKVADHTPKSVVRGIQITLGVLLGWEGLKMMAGIGAWSSAMASFGSRPGFWALGVVSVVVVLALKDNKHAPAALVLMALGVVVGIFRGGLLDGLHIGFRLPPLTPFSPGEVWDGMLLAGFAQLPLTATNAVLATAALIKEYWPDRSVSERKLALNMGLMNTTTTLVGGMPMCHGSGGLAGQYYFGARTGGTNIIEGTIEIGLGMFFSSAIVGMFSAFPMSIVGAMMFMVGLNLARYALTLRAKDFMPTGATVAVSMVSNMALGFLLGLAVYFGIKYYYRLTRKCAGRTPLLNLTPRSKL
ncbi:putative sulfate/molybdate transporter [Candidatus Latescibacterota bacterium]